MNNIAELKKEFERKIRWAEIENEYDKVLEMNGLRMNIYSEGLYKTGALKAPIRNNDSLKDYISENRAGEVLRWFPSSSKCMVGLNKDRKIELDYLIETHRGVNDLYTIMRITWIARLIWMKDDIEFSMDIPIMGDLSDYFSEKTRELSDTEINVYGIQKNRWTVNLRKSFPYYVPCDGEKIEYYGGYTKSMCQSWISVIIEYLKNLPEENNK